MRNILKDYTIFRLDPAKLRSRDFYKNMLELHEKLMEKFKETIKPSKLFTCILCQSDKGKLFLEYRGYSLFECNQCGLVSPNIDFQKIKDQDIYEDEGSTKLEEDGVIDPAEEGFMKGAAHDGEDAKCRECGEILVDDHLEKEINGKVMRFCCDSCLEKYEEKHQEETDE